MRVFAFRHAPYEDLGTIRDVLASLAIDVECFDLYTGAPAPDIAAADGLIFMGGPMGVNDGLPYLDREMELIRDAAQRSQPVLGICLGAQLIAGALGGRVYRNAMPEIGWFHLRLASGASTDQIFSQVSASPTVFQWHNDTFDLPPGATLLASTDVCPNQAFRCGGSIYGLQFHPEMTAAMIVDWQTHAAQCGEPVAPIDPAPHGVDLPALCRTIVAGWSKVLYA
jgi:GMP synthase-like glutamine amidotransferase